MKVSNGVEWGFHAAVLIAQAPAGSSVTRQQVADYHGLPESYLAKHLKSLVGAGILSAVTGPNGGYRLGRSADQISGLDIFQAIEGKQFAFQCLEIRQQGTGAASPAECRRMCAVNALMISGEAAWRARLAQTTVADLVDAIPEHIQERNARRLTRGVGAP